MSAAFPRAGYGSLGSLRAAWTARRVLVASPAGNVALCGSVLLLFAWSVWPALFHGWIPADDGGMAQVAERVLDGQLPHRDFEDPWTGGWGYLQAAWFKLFGVTLAALRVPIFIAWLAGIAIAFATVRVRQDQWLATLAALACGVWSLYAWNLPLLNWYYAPLALGAVLAALCFHKTRRMRWLFGAGFLTGAAIAIKSTGFFLLAALLLWLADVASQDDRAPDEGIRKGFTLLIAAMGLTYLWLTWSLAWQLPTSLRGSAFAQFVAPQLFLCGWLTVRAWRKRAPLLAGLRRLVRLLMPLLGGLAAACAPLLLWYAWHGALGELMYGVFVRPQLRFQAVFYPPPGRLVTALALVPLAALSAGVGWARLGSRPIPMLKVVGLGASLGALAHVPWIEASAVSLFFRAAPVLLPLVALAWEVGRAEQEPATTAIVLPIALACTSQFMQVPFAYYNYFLYVAPIGLVATTMLLASRGEAGRAAALFWLSCAFTAGFLQPPQGPYPQRWSRLANARGGLEVPVLDSVRYARVEAAVRERPAGPLFVLGDVPELTFLTRRASPSRLIYDIVSDASDRDPVRMLRMLDSAGVHVVALRHSGARLDSLRRAQFTALRHAYPEGRVIWPFEVRWRTSPAR